jgi:hypothetical protein
MSLSAAILDRRRLGAGKKGGGDRYSSAVFPLFFDEKMAEYPRWDARRKPAWRVEWRDPHRCHDIINLRLLSIRKNCGFTQSDY